MNHTPGPWKVVTLGECCWGNDCKGHIDVESVDGTTITTAPLPMERIADARLIAAAPELLEAANKVIVGASNSDGTLCRTTSWSALKNLQAAIAPTKP